LDVVGQNYRENEILAAHAQKPTRKIIGTENTHTLATWLALRDNPPYAGQFLWTGVDYLGEAHQWPTIGASTGLLDRTDAPRARAFERASWWSDTPVVCAARVEPDAPRAVDDPATHVAPPLFMDWTPANLSPHSESVNVYSNCAQVELFLNGQSLGSQSRPADDSPRHWRVAFAPGTLRTVGTDNGKVVATDELRTAGPARKIVLSADQTTLPNDWDDVCYVRAIVEDANGLPVPRAADLITFKVSGPGAVAAVDNGDRDSIEPFQASQRHAFQGQCIAILRATAPAGQITLTASAPGLISGTATLQAHPAP
jgi:beta-galactosidase